MSTEVSIQLPQDEEFVRFLSQKRETEESAANMCQREIDRLMAKISAERENQSRHLRVAEGCVAAIASIEGSAG